MIKRSIVKDYVSFYHKRKTVADQFENIRYKYLMNSVYGKLAERERVFGGNHD